MPSASPGLAGEYLPIAEHGLVGDLHSVALVGTNGTIDWFCCPAFDSPSVFGSLLDAGRGGFFALAAAIPARTRQFYLPDTNVLITRFFAEEGVGEIQDFMPLRDPSTGDGQRLIRRVQCVRGTMPFRMRAAPRFNYGSHPHVVSAVRDGVLFTSPELSLYLGSTEPLAVDERDAVTEFTLEEGGVAVFSLEHVGSSTEFTSVPEGGDARSADGDGALLVGLALRLAVSGALAGGRSSVRTDAQAVDVRPYRGDHRRAHDEPSGTDRRGTELGLSLRMDPGRCVLRLRAAAARIRGRGDRIHELPDPVRHSRREPTWTPAGHVRHRRTGGSGGAGAARSRGLPRVGPGAGGERRGSSAAARHLWRAHGLGLPLRQVGATDLLRPVGGDPGENRLGLQQLGPAR